MIEATTPEVIYCGPREAIITEVGGLAHIYPGKYLIQPDGPAAWDADGADTLADLEALIAEYRQQFPGIKIVRL